MNIFKKTKITNVELFGKLHQNIPLRETKIDAKWNGKLCTLLLKTLFTQP